MGEMTDLEWLAREVDHWDDRFDSVCKDEKGRVEWFNSKFFDGKQRYNKTQWQAERHRLQNKPSWDDAPEWAVCLTQDSDGTWAWWNTDLLDPGDISRDYWIYDDSGVKFRKESRGEVLCDWRDTLERRPEAEAWDEERIDQIAQNGGEALHYDLTKPGGVILTRPDSQDLGKEQKAGSDLSRLYPKYHKDVSGYDTVDVYAIHKLFKIDDPSGCLQHSSKKILLSGVRTGGKPKRKDIEEARDTLTRWLELNQ